MPSLLDQPYFHDEAAAYAKLESIAWPNGPVCVHCGEAKRIAQLKGTATRFGLHKCYACRRQFRVTVGTVFEGSHIALKHWLQAVVLIVSSKKRVTSDQIHRTMGVTLKSAWLMSRRIREAMQTTDPDQAGDDAYSVEEDATEVHSTVSIGPETSGKPVKSKKVSKPDFAWLRPRPPAGRKRSFLGRN